MIETTVYMRREDLDILKDAAEKSGVAKKSLVSSLLNLLSRRERRICRAWERVRYQQRNGEGGWKRLHVKLRADEYEFSIDLRKVMKMSVSFLISYAINHYLKELLEMLAKNGDNYQYRNYAIMNIVEENVSCWILCWGIPPQIPVVPGSHG